MIPVAYNECQWRIIDIKCYKRTQGERDDDKTPTVYVYKQVIEWFESGTFLARSLSVWRDVPICNVFVKDHDRSWEACYIGFGERFGRGQWQYNPDVVEIRQ